MGLIAVILTGCVSTKKRYQQAVEQETAGDFIKAAELYIRVLDSDRDFEDARARLSDVGARAIAGLWDSAEEHESRGAFDLAVQNLDRMYALKGAAEDVRVILTLPGDFGDRREFLVEAALDTLSRRSEAAVAAGDLEGALKLLERMRNEFELDDARADDVDHRLGAVLVDLARYDMDQGRFKSGYDTALRAVEILDVYDDPAEDEARGVADRALAEGIQTLALVPLWETDAWGNAAPADLRADVNDAIAFGEAGRGSAFLAILDPGQTRRIVRSEGMAGSVLTRSDFRELGSELGADFVLGGELVGYERSDRVRRSKERDTRTRGRGGVDTTYTWQQLDVRTKGLVAYRVWSMEASRFVLERTVEADTRVRVERGAYSGRWGSLDLTGSEQLLFDREEWQRQDREMMIELSDKLAARLMREVDDALVKLID
jgi:tetratricopeptide (TPR) repeat protein